MATIAELLGIHSRKARAMSVEDIGEEYNNADAETKQKIQNNAPALVGLLSAFAPITTALSIYKIVLSGLNDAMKVADTATPVSGASAGAKLGGEKGGVIVETTVTQAKISVKETFLNTEIPV